MENFKFLENKLINFLSSYLNSSKANGFILGLSGGLDSAVVATLCSKVAPTKALIMPTSSSNKVNLNDALTLCQSLKIDHQIVDISEILASFLPFSDENDRLRVGNITARIRMIMLYDQSAKLGYLVAGTSNKSERLLGYGTIYGDMACALNPIANIYKSDLFKFASYLEINQNIIDKAPSADLWPNQSDESELGYSYKKIDELLKAIENSDDLSKFDSELKSQIIDRMAKNSFKLKPPAIP
ncbi:NAD+ synthase [Campylobacter sp. CX2-8023-23]|uniref:NH(3)-dependent NAD(+) synthetase n=1 Tax=Campylobacter porcelli TaxID=1660073 RepID=A0ABU7M318_9BACT|nr:NAD+ synthase [Campylobacter sp. CX2-8023-23]MEE3743810.1 NAD+ synthase [Campylobacter sp. CX2-4855-23]MEE3776069.1 NAD+ synthase [Campylobacter sp. CX2-4080-23]